MNMQMFHQQTGRCPDVQVGFLRPDPLSPVATPPLRASSSIEQRNFIAEDEAALHELQKSYVFSEPAVRETLMDQRELIPLLRDAVQNLQSCFGRDVLLHLRAPVDESGSRTVYAVVLWNGSARQVRQSLANFDSDWWLARAARAKGILTFTYELV